MRKYLATYGKHGKQEIKKAIKKTGKSKIKNKQRYEKGRTCLLIITI